MKKTLLTTVLSCLILTACASTTNHTSETSQQSMNPNPAHNAKNSLDWNGTYKGVFPCADCEGIAIQLELKNNYSYVLTEQYKGQNDVPAQKTQGRFSFDKTGSIITLDQKASERKFFVGENFIAARDKQTGEEITGPLAEYYILKKVVN